MKPSVIVWDLETVPDFDGLTPMMSGLRTRVRAIRAVFFFSFDTRDDFKTLKSNRAPLPTSVGLPSVRRWLDIAGGGYPILIQD
jgi:hypothetical protein